VPTAPVRYLAAPVEYRDVGGHIDSATEQDGHLTLSGWAPWSGSAQGHALEIVLVPPAAGTAARAMMFRADLAGPLGRGDAALNGFLVKIPLSGAATQAACVFAHDGQGTRWLLPNPDNLPYCKGLSRGSPDRR